MKHLLVLILISSQVLAQTAPVTGTNQNLPGGQQDCSQYTNVSDQQACQQNQMRPQQPTTMATAQRVRDCNELLRRVAQGAPAATAPQETEEITETRDGQGRLTGSQRRVLRPSAPAAPSVPAGSRPATTGAMVYTTITTGAPAAPPTIPFVLTDVSEIRNCRALQMTAAGTDAGSFEASQRQNAMDGRIYCVRIAGYTADYQSCIRALNMYNNVKMAEAALFVVQSVQAQNNQRAVENQTAQRVAAGDGQNAAFDAQISATSKASQLNQQKAAAYAAAVAALGSQYASWIKDDEATVIRTLCSGNPQSLSGTPPFFNAAQAQAYKAAPSRVEYVSAAAVSAPECTESVRYAYRAANGEVMANNQAKNAIKMALLELIAKGVQAGLAAKQLGDVAKQVEDAKNQTEDPYNPATFARCDLTPNDPACLGPAVVTPGSGLQDGGFSFGDNFGNNAFNPVADPEDMTTDAPGPLAGDAVVPGTSNPFSDDAKVASGILDPAAAASIQPGGGAGGGGGGGAGSPGGGSASLGNDTPGMDDSKKESDIKANKADGKYNIASGSGFSAVKGMKEDNPFANLFDGKGGGKLEEDRSIASGDIDGKDSGIFAKISKRYNQVQADKRIEAKNLEE